MNFPEEKALEDEPETKSSSFWFLFVLAIVAVCIVAVVWFMPPLSRASKGASHQTVGTKLTKLQFTPLTGDAAPLSLDRLEGKVVLINFWGTWCPPCRQEFPHLVTLQNSLASETDFQLVSVSCLSGKPVSSAEELAHLRVDTIKFLQTYNADIPTYADERAVSRGAIMADTGFNNFGYPTTVLIDRGGVIRGMWVGYVPGDADDMLTLTKQILGEDS